MNELSITVHIADRPYHLTIDRKNEKIIRKAAKAISVLLKEYSEIYAFKDKQDLLAMATLNYTTLAFNSENRLSFNDDEWSKKLLALDEILTNCT